MANIITGHRVGQYGTIRVGCSAVIFNKSNEKILLTRREDNNQWCLPSGGMESGESASETCIREVEEETGLRVEMKRIIGIYTSPDELVVYQDGNKIQLVAICFEAKIVGGELRLSCETTEYGYFSYQEIQELDLLLNHVQRIKDAYSGEMMTFIR
ncbi:MAG: NUDIX domain-containing protein [Candidatus Poribacteria bacterium]|nr:NUDIX domain-containing protein [Candidatus Poribacteria bacterium]